MIDADLLRNRVFTTAVGTNAVSTFALVGNAVFMTAYLQLVLGYSPLRAALWSLVPTVGVGLSAPFASGLAHRFGPPGSPRAAWWWPPPGFGVLTRAGTDSLGARPGRRRRPGLRPGRHHDRRLRAGPGRGASPSRRGRARRSPRPAPSWAVRSASRCSAASAPRRTARTPATTCRPTPCTARRRARCAGGLRPGGARVLAVARDAYVHGLHVAALAGAAVLVLVAAVAPAMSDHSAHCF